MQELKTKSIILLHGVFAPQAIKNFTGNPPGKIFVMEGRPGLEAAENNCRALLKVGKKPTLISDNMAGFLFYKDLVQEVRIAVQYSDKDGALGATGALMLGVLARRHKVPVNLYPGKLSPRFLGDPKEVLVFKGKTIAPKGTKAYVPLVEWLPGKYITSALPGCAAA